MVCMRTGPSKYLQSSKVVKKPQAQSESLKSFFFKKSFKVIKVLELLGKALEYTYFMYQIHPQLPQCNTPTFCNTTYICKSKKCYWYA